MHTSSSRAYRLTQDGNFVFDSNIESGGFSDFFSITPAGWQISQAGTADFRSIFADELIVKAFTAEVAQALAGSDFLTKSVTTLSRNFVVPAVGTTGTLFVDDLEGLEEMQTFEPGDWVRLRIVDRTGGGLTVGDIYGTVTAYTNLANGEQSWTFTVDYAGPSGSLVGTTVYKGSIALDYGVSGDTYIERTVLDRRTDITDDFSRVPYDRIVKWTNTVSGSPRPGDQSTTTETLTQRGQLFNITGNNEYGAYFKDIIVIDIDGGSMKIGKDAGGANVDGIHLDANNYWHSNQAFKVQAGVGNLIAVSGGSVSIKSTDFTLDSLANNKGIILESATPRFDMLAEFGGTAKEVLSIQPGTDLPAALHLYASGTDSQSPMTTSSMGVGVVNRVVFGGSILLSGPGKHNFSYTFDVDLTSANSEYIDNITIRILAADAGSPSFRHIVAERVINQSEFWDGAIISNTLNEIVFGNVENYEDVRFWARITKTDTTQDAGIVTISNVAWEESNTTLAVNALGIFQRVNSAVVVPLGSATGGSSTGGLSTGTIN